MGQDKTPGHEKGRKWWAWLTGQQPSDLGQALVVDGDTAYFAWTEGARLMGVEPYRVMVEPVASEREKRGTPPDPDHDPWYWLKTEDKYEPKRAEEAGSRATKKRKSKGKDAKAARGKRANKATKLAAKRPTAKRRGKTAGRNPKSNR